MLQAGEVELVSREASIGRSDSEFRVNSDGRYSMEAATGIYLQDDRAGVRVTTTGQGSANAVVSASKQGDWNLGALRVQQADVEMVVGGNLAIDRLQGNSVKVVSDGARIKELNVEQALETQVDFLAVSNLVSDATGMITLNNSGRDGGQAKRVDITSALSNTLVLNGLNTYTGNINFAQSSRVNMLESHIFGNLYLTTANLSFLINGNDFRWEAADVGLILPPGGLELYVEGNNYTTAAPVLFSSGGARGSSFFGKPGEGLF